MASDCDYKAFLEAVIDGKSEEAKRHLTAHPEFLDRPNNYNNGYTPLHYAAMCENDLTVKLLLQHGSMSVNSTNNYGYTPLRLAAIYNRGSTMRILKAVGATIPVVIFDGLRDESIAMLREVLSEEEILEIRFRIYFSMSLLSLLLF